VERRPKPFDVIEALERGDADALAVAKLDRLARSIADLVGKMSGRSRRRGWELLTLDMQIHTSTPTGTLFGHLLATIAVGFGAVLVPQPQNACT